MNKRAEKVEVAIEDLKDSNVADDGAAATTYDLSDGLDFGSGISVVSASVANTSPGSIATLAGWDGSSNLQVVDDQPIAPGAGHVYRVEVIARVAPTTGPSAMDCTTDPDESGTGYLNHATLTSDSTPINDDVANVIVAQLLFLESEDPDKPINLYINSPGGSVTAGLAIYDTMQYVRPPVSTICVGQAASMGALLLLAGAKGKRFALPNARIMIHQPLGGAEGQATDIEIHAKEIIDVRRRLDEILAKHTKQDLEKVAKDTERDYFMSAEEAKAYNLIDRVIEKH